MTASSCAVAAAAAAANDAAGVDWNDERGAVLEEGTALGRDGLWYACRRYSQR